jgi:signal transduction histidine kinase
VVLAAALAHLASVLLAWPASAPSVLFVAVPALVGRYLVRDRRLDAVLSGRGRELIAEQERLRIARDVHDTLGHRLSLIAVQAHALRAATPGQGDDSVRQLAESAHQAVVELHELVGALRQAPDDRPAPNTVDGIDRLVAEFHAAGVRITLRHDGTPVPTTDRVGQAAYRVVQEGLTNAVKHAPGQEVTVVVRWEADALLVSVTNGLPAEAAGAGTRGHGMSGLAERVRLAGGLLHTERSSTAHRLSAMLPLADENTATTARGRRVRVAALSAAAAAVVLLTVPASLLPGVG